MEDAEYAERVEELLMGLKGRIKEPIYGLYYNFIIGGEHVELMHQIAGRFIEDRIPISPKEREELRALLYDDDMPLDDHYPYFRDRDEVMAGLNVVEDPRPEPAPGIRIHRGPADSRDALFGGPPVALHVDFPTMQCNLFDDYFSRSAGIALEVNLRLTNPDVVVVNGQSVAPRDNESGMAMELLRMLSRDALGGGGVLLRSFEQFWVRNRSQAEELITALPPLLAEAKSRGKILHVALAELSARTADEAIALLRSVTTDRADDPVPVFRYEAM
ncbi:hypothetical protein [Saccharopolyspora taberi]|uniref:Uncharacterized protein n=1 Tax=Saccharopolyspora taberi TaxID=60895 RepID=A0ABN3VLT4_9PSEU